MSLNNKRRTMDAETRAGNATTENSFTRIQASAADLRAMFKGRVITVDDADYDAARSVFYGGVDRKPAAIIRVADAQDVARAISLVRDDEMGVAVRSGGHSNAGYSVTEGGIVIDLRDMRNLEIDAKNRTAWVETGLTAGEFTSAADAYGLATGFGDTGSVGIGGITLGGGVGYLSRLHGLTIDHLLAAEIVTADGQIHQVDADNEPDLFWAIRGGGGNFGVATRFKFQLHELGDMVGGMLVLPATPDVISEFIRAAKAAPEQLSTIANIMPAPPMPFLPAELYGKLVILAMIVYAGKVDAGMKAVAPFRTLAQPLADMLRPMRYPEMFPPEDPSYHPTAVGYTTFMDEVDNDSARTIVEYLLASDAPLRVTQLRVLGGAVGRVQNDATAYAHRHRAIMANLAAFYTGLEDRVVRQKWVADFASALHDDGSNAYVNFLGDEGERRVRAAYPASTWERLTKIKTKYDPTNLFRLNQNIPPSG